jgi:predicted nucleic acid-binding protein
VTVTRWLLDTSAYTRRHIPAVKDALRRHVESGDELCFATPTLLELLRTPRGEAVAGERDALREAFEVVALSERTGELAADAMVSLAANTTDGHRLPVADLLTAALAAEGGLGVLHVDKHFDRLATAGGLGFPSAAVCSVDDLARVAQQSPAARQRELRRTLNGLLSRLPVERAEQLLAEFTAHARAAVDDER